MGAHLEGPYIAAAAAGGFDPSFITTPQDFDLSGILDAGSDLIRIVTLSPELPGTERVVRELVRRRIVASLGHSMAGLQEYSTARSAGATHCCHTYNNRRTFPDSISSACANKPARPSTANRSDSGSLAGRLNG